MKVNTPTEETIRIKARLLCEAIRANLNESETITLKEKELGHVPTIGQALIGIHISEELMDLEELVFNDEEKLA